VGGTLALAAALAAGCSDGSTADLLGPARATPTPSTSTQAGPSTSPQPTAPSYAVEEPGPLEGRLYSSDVLVTGADTLPAGLVERVRSIEGVEAVLPLSIASSAIDGRTLNVAAVDPAEFRRFTPYASAHATAVWRRVAGGEVAVDAGVSRKLISRDDTMALSNSPQAPEVHVGAYAPLVNRIQAVVNVERGEQLGIPEGNALLVSTGRFTPSALAEQFEAALDGQATMQTLALEFDVAATQTAVLTGASVSDAVGTFSYTNRSHGEISPDPRWVREYIRTERVPILGSVTCNKAMLPQLRGALQEVVRRGLADEIHADEYAGCYYPRYIGRDPANGLSLHSWGIAVDLNVPGNLRGTAGEIDRTVVAIFKSWGFAWGGDWNYTDPMHFEMNAVVRASGG
jgi:hypothetical protein